MCVCPCDFVFSLFDDSGEGSNWIIARLDDVLHLHPQRSLVARVTWACVNTSPLKAKTSLNGYHHDSVDFLSCTHTRKHKVSTHTLTYRGSYNALRHTYSVFFSVCAWACALSLYVYCKLWIFNVPSGVFLLHLDFTCSVVKHGPCVCVCACTESSSVFLLSHCF